ncbi:ABC transporter substrate-binding protein [Terrabacter sp. NPDC080008]|uniref:ABC transporter substrate-binding protein n=1 Tax=Terrabacter sp. NPDC080008 TaxID=3155176 RepID=UPI00344EF359
MRRRPVRLLAVATLGVLALGATACTADPAPMTPTGGTSPRETPAAVTTTTAPPKPLVVDAVFDHTSLDPTQQFNRSGSMLSHALYETLTSLDPGDPTKVEPGLADYTISPEGRWLTFRLRKGVHFSDGTPMTTDDVLFTIERAKGLGGPVASLLGQVSTVKVDERTFTLSSPSANFALPAILANPAFGILNSTVVKANGGTIGPDDTATGYLSTHSAGSGPYVLDGVRGSSEVRLAPNPHWTGTRPKFPELLVRNVAPQQQLADITSGRADVALDLSPSQASEVARAGVDPTASPSATAGPDAAPAPEMPAVTVKTMRSSTLVYLALSRTKAVNAWTSNPDFVDAVRLGLDRVSLADSAPGSEPAAGLVPAGIVGALKDVVPQPTPSGTTTAGGPTASTGTPTPTVSTPSTPTTSSTPGGPVTSATGPAGGPSAVVTTGADGIPTPVVTLPLVPPRHLAAARAALKRSGYAGQPIPLTYAADLPIQGIPRTALATAVRDQLAEVGVKVKLNPAPARDALAAYREGRTAFGLWSWSPDYLDPENYLAFGPGELLGSRAGWRRGTDPALDDLTEAASASVGDDRAAAYAAWQLAMNARSPFVPLLQPATRVASGARVEAAPGNPVWTLDLARIH